jgi:alcohol dehydrogenase class IV
MMANSTSHNSTDATMRSLIPPIGAAPWTLKLPVPVEFGVGSVQKLPDYLQETKRVLLVTGQNAMRAAGVTGRLERLFQDREIECRLFDRVSAEPDFREIEEAARLAREFQAEAIVGCGGGSALDAAKAIAVATTHPGCIMDYILNGPKQVTAAALPVMAVTATSGTGSHVGRVAVLSDGSRGVKRAIISDHIYPRAAVADPEILRHMPPSVTATSGFDAFAQALEGFLSTSENPLGNACAREAMRLIAGVLPKAVEHGEDLQLRAAMAWADTLQGISLATNAVLTPHVIAMVLGGRFRIPHARAIATVMVPCLRHSRPSATAKLAEVARLMGCEESSDEALADMAIDAVDRLIAAIGLKKTLREHNVAGREFRSIAEEVRTNFALRLDADPVPKSVDDLVAILEEAN